jgi:rod shape-determining protein MreC
LLLALIASTILFFLDTRFNSFAAVRSNLAAVVYPIQVVASLPTDIAEWFDDFFEDRHLLQERNAALEVANLLNSQRLQKYQNLERENMRLRELLGSSFRLRDRVKVAEILMVDLDPFSQQVVINKGEQNGIFIGQAVLDATGVMGQVVSTSAFSSHVVLLTNPNHAVPIQVSRNGLRAIVKGRGLGELLEVDYLPHNADIRKGDLLVTSGLGGRFPTGYPVGTVESVNYPQGKAFVEIRVKSAAHIAISREVLLVLNTKMISADNSDSVNKSEASANE